MESSRRRRPWASAPSVVQHAALEAAGLTAVGVIDTGHSGRSAEPLPRTELCWHGSTNAVWQPGSEARIFKELMSDVNWVRRRRRCDGVIDARLSSHHAHNRTVFEFHGVLVRVAGGPYPHGFVTHLGGSELAHLIGSGWIPVSLARGVAIGSHHEPAATRGRRLRFGNEELTTWTSLLAETRASARQDLAAQVAGTGAAGALLGVADLDTRLTKCPDHHGRDRLVRAAFIATTVVRFADRAATESAATLDLAR